MIYDEKGMRINEALVIADVSLSILVGTHFPSWETNRKSPA